MITMPFMMGARAKEEVWEITVNTEATTAGAKTTGIPISLYEQPGITMTVDWGDGTESVLTQASYTEGDYTPSTHEYANPGTYTVQIKSTRWKAVYINTLGSTSTGALTHIAAFRGTLVSAGQLPGLKGISYRSSSTAVSYLRVNSLDYCFYGCTSLTSIPAGLFNNNTAVTYFSSCFRDCSSLTTIPADLFANNTAVTSFSGCFRDCSSLTTIPDGLFDNNTVVMNFSNCFDGCSALTTIPADLFANNTAVTSFSYCFEDCTSLTSIPAGLFNNNTAVTSFSGCFRYCFSLTSIPAGLFNNNTAVTSFSYCFEDCTSLTSIPAGLFNNNTAVTSFSGCFRYCSSLTTIPADLFANNTAVTDLGECFRYCTRLTDFTLRIGSSLISSAARFVTKKSDAIRTIYVPAGSTTENTFNSIAADLGLTVIGE